MCALAVDEQAPLLFQKQTLRRVQRSPKVVLSKGLVRLDEVVMVVAVETVMVVATVVPVVVPAAVVVCKSRDILCGWSLRPWLTPCKCRLHRKNERDIVHPMLRLSLSNPHYPCRQ